VKEKSIQ